MEGGFEAEAQGSPCSCYRKRNDLLRTQYHRVRSQANEEGIRGSKEELLDESLLAMNTLLSVHGTTPYAALYGRAPNILLELGGGGSEFDDESGGAVSRHVHRVRELALANIAQ
eukprot:2998865-Pyramimonas_sp.AAC.1